MELHLTKNLENLINSRGGEDYVLKCIAYFIGNIETLSLYEYNYVCNMKVTVHDLVAIWKDGYSPMDKLLGSSYSKVMEVR